MKTVHQFTIEDDGKPPILAALRQNLPDQPSWSVVRKLLQKRKVTIGGVLCLDEGRRLTNGEIVAISDRPVPPPPQMEDVNVRYVDEDVVVAEKPSGMITLRRKS